MRYLPGIDSLAHLVTHIPNKGEQMVRYYGYYSNKSRGTRKKAGSDDQVPALVRSAVSSTAFRRNWARLLQKIYQIEPLLCPKCQGAMKVISFIEDDALIRKNLQQIGLWETSNHDPPQSNDAHSPTIETKLTTITHIHNWRQLIVGPNKGLFNGSISSIGHFYSIAAFKIGHFRA